MKKLLLFLIVILVFVVACSTKKNSFTSRTYHSVSSKYNVLYNGNVALDKGITELNQNYVDNFYEILPVEPLKITNEFKVTTEKKAEDAPKTDFDIAEEKAVKTVQKHSMNIYGDEKNNQIDEAYFLLGKSRYYTERFIPALEAFDFSLKNYPNGNLNNDIRIWKAKTLIRLQNEDQGVDVLKNLLKRNDITNAQREQAHTALAMAFQALEKNDLVTQQLIKANETNINPEQIARNWFIVGQLYYASQKTDSAKWAFDKIISDKKSPKKYKIHAYLEEAKQLTDKNQTTELKEKLTKLSKDFLNKSYLDEIYYQLAHLNLLEGHDSIAQSLLTQSVKLPEAKSFQKVLSYEKLGDYFYDKNKYVIAGAYYDSVRPFVENANTKHIKKLERKIKNLRDVVDYENTLSHNDSILRLTAMSEAERINFFEKYIAQMKKNDELKANQKENALSAMNSVSALNKSDKKTDKNSTSFYFNNAQTVDFGRIEFEKIWGKRALKDNWRWSDNRTSDLANTKRNQDPTTKFANQKNDDNQYSAGYYLKTLPKSDAEFQKIYDENGRALYQLGLIYKEKLHNYDLAEQRLTRFLNEKPKENLILPAKYHLFRIYELQNNPKQTEFKNAILSGYSDSRYAQMLQDKPMSFTEKDSIVTPETHYEKVYCDFEYDRYPLVVEECESAIKQYVDEPIQAKFDLLKAYAQFYTKGKNSFVENLEYVVANYPKTEEAVHAQDVLDRLNGVVREKKEDIKIQSVSQPDSKKTPTDARVKELAPTEQKPKLSPEDDRRERVLEMMKQSGPPPAQTKKAEK